MIVMRLYGGLGNQMFQYAAGYALSVKLNTTLALDISYIAYNQHRPYALHNLAISCRNTKPRGVPSALRRRISEGLGRRNVFLRRMYDALFMQTRYTIYHANESTIHFVDETFFELEDNTYIVGYFQMPQYFSHLVDVLQKEFMPCIPLSNRAEIYKNTIEQSKNTVSIHMRFGDFSEEHRLQKNYYNAAISYINARIDNPCYFVFSDEIEKAKSFFHNDAINGTIQYIESADSDRAYEDMHLMKLCSHNIIANSSFSWWAAFLNTYPNKVVITPSMWRKSIAFPENAFPHGWVSLTLV